MTDECVANQLARFLRQIGHDVTLSPERSASFGDPEVIAAAAAAGRILITTDLRLQQNYWDWIKAGKDHPGLLIGVQRHGDVGRLIQDARITIESLDPEALRNNIRWLGS